jgi:hypothetical protein
MDNRPLSRAKSGWGVALTTQTLSRDEVKKRVELFPFFASVACFMGKLSFTQIFDYLQIFDSCMSQKYSIKKIIQCKVCSIPAWYLQPNYVSLLRYYFMKTLSFTTKPVKFL